jgi:hypothetical protein
MIYNGQPLNLDEAYLTDYASGVSSSIDGCILESLLGEGSNPGYGSVRLSELMVGRLQGRYVRASSSITSFSDLHFESLDGFSTRPSSVVVAVADLVLAPADARYVKEASTVVDISRLTLSNPSAWAESGANATAHIASLYVDSLSVGVFTTFDWIEIRTLYAYSTLVDPHNRLLKMFHESSSSTIFSQEHSLTIQPIEETVIESRKATAAIGADNQFRIKITIEDQLQDHSRYTSATLKNASGTIVATSLTSPNAWNFTDPSEIVVTLGRTGLPIGTKEYYLTVVSVDHPNGYLLDVPLTLTILA